MNKPMITNEDRGITLNKSLAWTIGVALVSVGLFVGMELAATRTQQKNILEQLQAMQQASQTRQSEAALARSQLDTRLRAVETTTAADRSEITALRRELGDFRTELRQTVQILQQLR